MNEVTITTDQAIHSLSINAFGVLQFTAPVTLTINGDFSKDVDAIFDPGNDWFEPVTGGTVVFGPGNNIINTHGQVVDFYNLSKVASGAGEKLSVDPLVTEQGGIHILHSLTLRGAGAGSLLTLASTTPGSQWGIWPEDGTDVNYVNVQDSDNLGDPIAVAVGEGTNTTNWNFGLGAYLVFGEPERFIQPKQNWPTGHIYRNDLAFWRKQR